MKILLLSSDIEAGRIIMREIKKDKPHVVETVEDDSLLILEIARTTPHLLVIHSPEGLSKSSAISKQAQLAFPDLPVCLIHGDLTLVAWKMGLLEVLSKPLRPETPQPYPKGLLRYYTDPILKRVESDPSTPPERKECLESLRSQQETRFLLQLQTARKNHSAAKNYFACLTRQQEGLDHELGRGMAHGSYEALSLCRDLAVRWLAVLAHYTPDAELEYLPKPGTAGPNINFVHRDIPVEGAYAAMLIAMDQINPTIYGAILDMVSARFRGQDEEDLFATSLKLWGLAQFFQQVATAEIELMDRFIDPMFMERLGDVTTLDDQETNMGIFRDFWNFTSPVIAPQSLRSLLSGFHADTIHFERDRILPSFAEFRRGHQR